MTAEELRKRLVSSEEIALLDVREQGVHYRGHPFFASSAPLSRLELVIGVGEGIGKNHLQGLHDKASENNIVVAAACDVFNKRRDWAKEKAELKDADLYSDHRKLLERKDLDAVLIATHDPWHAQLTIDALEAGKHVYCEKPLTRYLDEAFKVYDAVKRTGRVFQVGSQGCSAAGCRARGYPVHGL